ncbi:hypothetical protein [Hymenobacter norwichensis]|uniref:hypothetical protein n=1 Tax=Hymenobacter norwichensis TaxID=223903 RepID=UPI0003B397AA|nr:hypothetical protein [Hymenobacter norwichensis]
MSVATTIFRKAHQSQLGLIELQLQTSDNLFPVENEADIFRTVGHTVEVRKLTTPPEWLPSSMQVEAAIAWLFYITKHNAGDEQLTFSAGLQSEDNIEGQTTTGQYLCAIEFENGVRQLHIGAEDEEAMAQRAYANDWMPLRLASPLWNSLIEVTSITSDKRGICTRIPQLQTGEQFYFHYILAENPYRELVNYPGEIDLATWIAVDQPKHRLEQAWLEHTQKLRP